MKTTTSKKVSNADLYKEVTAKIISLLETHQTQWNRTWVSLGEDGQPAYNALTNRRYTGINQLLLSLETTERRYAKNAWLTFLQIKQQGGAIQKGEKATRIYFHKTLFVDEKGKKYDPEIIKTMSKERIKKLGIKRIPILKYYNVFNVFQTTGLPEKCYHYETSVIPTALEKDERAERLIQSTGATIDYKANQQPCYLPVKDVIQLPLAHQFKGTEHFYNTALHELAHWTGHHTRLDREIINTFGSPKYALEELVAELTAAFLCTHLGFTKTISNNTSYIQSWLHTLSNDTRFIFKASRKAEQAAAFIMEKNNH